MFLRTLATRRVWLSLVLLVAVPVADAWAQRRSRGRRQAVESQQHLQIAAGRELVDKVHYGRRDLVSIAALTASLHVDGHRADLVHQLSQALTTPFDREDLFRVSRSVDDVLDNLRDFARELDLYGVEREELFVPVIDAIIRGIEVLGDAIGGIVEQPTGTADAALAASKQSNEVRRLYQHQMAQLLDGDVSSGMLKRRELLRRLDVVGLRLGEAASALADGVLKRGY